MLSWVACKEMFTLEKNKMRLLTLFILSFSVFACTDTKKSFIEAISDKNPVDPSCDCQYFKEQNMPLYATNIAANQKNINFNCAQIEVAIAEKADVNGVPQGCEYLYTLQCVSSKSQQLILADQFRYSKNVNTSSTQSDFYKDLKENPKAIFEFSLNAQNQIIEIEKLEL
ncbi:hypothetical protein SAMN05660477_02734 [Soonwooa buanensis]|uniref:Uncharacterized protein n=2 Tax=Soonwooa buanensis TaxID=619805 RepID=A0A1T5GCY9_9FLAO|nr:hypothetical protein SAMN05660477_02734 [Soonwooa buanensis]